jgi:tRNA (guanosine-2'-O-)-methyltransferase
MKEKLIDYLSQFVTENKRKKMDEVLDMRTRYLTIVLEDIYQPQNASAVIRTCDCFGIQDLYIIENKNKYKTNPDVTLGSAKWVNTLKFKKRNANNTLDCITDLKSKGYKIIATSPHENDVNLDDLSLDTKTALFMGNEKEGISDEVIKHADGFMKIPMSGFTESLNISVSAAICIHHLVQKLWNSPINWKLTEQEKEEIKLKWIKKIIKKAELFEKDFLMRNQLE